MGAGSAARARALLGWYREHRRPLPWRETDHPYPILVSEVMLQQTQAERVVPRYGEFLQRFPTVERLAAAAPAEVLAAWSGLGYNRRALRLHEAARRIVRDGWPRAPERLRRLPGVGPYTAAAVACFAFGAQVPAPDTNLRRALSRWWGETLEGRRLEEAARAELPAGRAAAWNQAVMDLGAAICRPHTPDCPRCPVSTWCAGPESYRPRPAQEAFAGSRRQARGAVVRALVEGGPGGRPALQARTGLSPSRLDEALGALLTDGLVECAPGGGYRLPR